MNFLQKIYELNYKEIKVKVKTYYLNAKLFVFL
jgi:hypothetical protein